MKELLFLFYGAEIIYTDISINAVLSIKTLFDNSNLKRDHENEIIFESVDALNLPYEESTFDIIYGCAFVHHLMDISPFLKEVFRCLKPDGKCVFFDNGYSRWWQILKATILKPIQLLSHWKTGISPEDIVATKKGGYKEDEINEVLESIGFHSVFYDRVSFFEYFFHRGSTKLISDNISKPFVKIGQFFDRYFLTDKFLNKNGIDLVWGANK